ncbi:hypothetical protein DICPUDRAFT_159517 [Dictyostelium purpureum]|uniref:Myb-like domain-containing protein n=1 Tax=Dictyostelium purpureum TaxID=5786 RepID=F1A4B7_DICPU|nr:uncharacterized protein DICPUDRAFT_159517 [Dictyostelium purpureum]EGC28963.1 hypothetical protein DICPUDRAFT_159517 [Dictyostelium purpureum]|eukprot:XP_003294512.1 hypothetical protein DICPUDRAFT_159517 [Dictyostelium purpureum]
MSDVRDILGSVAQSGLNSGKNEIESILTGQGNTPKRTPKDTPKTTMEKLQQTFKSLEGETITFAPQQLTKSGLKEKRRIKVSWNNKAFRNNARNDGLILHHWVKSNEKPNDYKYSKFNKKMEILVYNEEEYDLYLRDDKWSREDTDLLLELCKRFDTRFIVIADRFEGQVKRTVEDLKERYYRIQSKLIELRTKPEEDPFHNPLTTYAFNKVYETQRKLQSDILFHLSKEEVTEEEQLVEKYNTIENHLLKHSKESKSVFKVSQIAINNGPMKHYSQHDLQNRGVQGSYTGKNKNKRKHSELDAQQQGGATEDDTQITLNTRQGARIESTLFDLHIGRPTNNFSKLYYNDLKEDVLILLDLQKYYMEKRYHCEILKSQRDFLKNELDHLKATIPAEALALHVDEENETIQNSTDDSSSTAHRHHHSSSSHHHSSSSHRHSSSRDHHSSSRDHHTTTTHHHHQHHKDHFDKSNSSTTPFGIYSGQFPEKQKETPLPSTEKTPEKAIKSSAPTKKSLSSSTSSTNTTQQHNTTTTTTTITGNSNTPIINPIIGTPLMSSINISPHQTQNIAGTTPTNTTSTNTPNITPNLGGIPIMQSTTIGVTSPNSEKKTEDSSGAFGNLNDFISQSLNNSIHQQFSKKMAKEKRIQEKADKKNASKKEKKGGTKTTSTPSSTPSSLTPASTPSTANSTPLVNQSFNLNVQQPPLINLNSPQSASSILTSPQSINSPASAGTISPSTSKREPKEKKEREPKEKKPKKEKKEKEPKEKKERKKREPKNSTVSPVGQQASSNTTAANITPIISSQTNITSPTTTATSPTNQMLAQVPLIQPISISPMIQAPQLSMYYQQQQQFQYQQPQQFGLQQPIQQSMTISPTQPNQQTTQQTTSPNIPPQ